MSYQGQGGQYSSEESIHSDCKTGEAGHSHVNGTLQEWATLQRRSFREWISPDVIGGMVAAPIFNAPHQTPWLHLCGEDP